MSQAIKKLQTGGNTPRTYGHLWVDGIDYGNSEEVYNAFANHARSQGLNQGEFYDQWLTALRNGQDVIFGNGNTVNLKPDDMTSKRAGKRSGWTRFWDDTFDTRRNHFSDAIATARGFTFRPTTKAKEAVEKASHYNNPASFDYQGEGKDAVYQKDNPGNLAIIKRFGSYLDWLENPDTWIETNQFSTTPTDEQAQALKAWYKNFGGDTPEARRSAAQAAIDQALEAVYNTKGGYDKVPENYRDLFEYFNINGVPVADNTVPTGGVSGSGSVRNPDGSINPDARTSNGGFIITKGNGNGDNDGYYTNWNADTSTPYIITRNDWDTLGLNGPYEFLRNGVIYNGRIWTPEELNKQTGSPLYATMERVKAINADTSLNGEERFNRLSQLANWYGKATGYHHFDWNPETYYTINPYLREQLKGYKNLSLYDASKSFGFEPGILLGVYDNSIAGTNNWGLRSPFYLMRDNNGRFITITEDKLSELFPLNTYNPYSYNAAFDSNALFTNWVDLMGDGRLFGLMKTIQGSDKDSRTGKLREYQIYEDGDGNFYHKKNNRELIRLTPELIEWILKGNKPTNRQMDSGFLDGNRRSNYQSGGGYARVNKNGGTINSYQIGGSFEGNPNGVQENNVDNSPLQTASYLQDSLTDADWKEISAAAIDLSGAIAGLVPGGSIYSAGSGLVSTGLYLSAAKDRKGKTDLGDWGQAGLATILDAVSLLPYIGEAGKLVKIGKGISKVAVPLGKVFNMIGLAHLVPTLTKNPKDWTSDDLIALSTGLTAALNVGHAAHTTRGETKLASEISKIRSSEPIPEFKYSSKMKIGDTVTDIELSSREIDSIVDKNNKTPGETLKQILKGRGVADDQLGNTTELLRQFGFDISGRKKIKASLHETPKPETYSDKNVARSILEQFNPWTSGASRRAYIDTNIKDPRVRAKIEAFATKRGKGISTTEKSINDEITTTTYNREFEDPRIRRAYAQSLMRLGDESANMNWGSRRIWSGAEVNPTTTETTVKRNPTNAQIEAASKLPERVSDAGLQMTRSAIQNPIAMSAAAQAGLPAHRTLAEATGFNPSISRETRLGAAAMSNKEIADWANNVKRKGVSASGEKVTVDDVVKLLNSLPANRRWSLIQYFRNNTKGKNTLEAAARFLPKRESGNTTIRDIRLRLNDARIIKDESTKAAFNEARDIASNLVALRESKDPMATLRLLSQKPGFDERAFAHSEEFREALEYAKTHGKYAKMSPKQKRQYDFELEQLMEGRNLLFKKGGKVVKAQFGSSGLSVLDQGILNTLNASKNGLFTTSNVYQSRVNNDPLSTSSWYGTHVNPFNPINPTSNIISGYNSIFGNPVAKFNNNYTSSTQDVKPVTSNTQDSNPDLYGDPNYDSSPAWINLINAGLGALDYGSMAWGRRKVHDQIQKGLWDSLYKKVTPRLQGITTATPIEDAAVSRYDQYVQRGLTTPLTSDNVINTQNVLTLQANALQGRDQAVRQQSAAALQRQMQNQQIVNQQNTIDADAENDFRQRLAGVRMNLAQNDASLTAQTAQSIQNLAREWRTRFDQQTAKYNQLQYNRTVKDATDKADRDWLAHVQKNYNDIWTAWNNADKSKYGYDFNTWAQSTNGMWTPEMETAYNSNRNALSNNIIGYYKNYNLDPSINWMFRNRYGVPVKKTGGTLTIKQRNRYKNEPWEDIWINQNKATHQLVAKLNDNIIKTFLKTLK